MYAKLYQDIIFSTVWEESKETRLLWVAMLALADADGVVRASFPGLVRAANLSLEDVEKSLPVLMAPDPQSKSQKEEGRRVTKIPDGYLIVNYIDYRNYKSDAERREETRKRVAKHRAHKHLQQDVTGCNATVTNVTPQLNSSQLISNSTKKVQKTLADTAGRPSVPTCPITEVLEAWNIAAAKLGLATVRVNGFAESRKKKLRQRWQEWGETDEERIATFEAVLKKIGESDFLRGKEKGNWRIDFAFLIENDHNWQKVHRGGFGEGEGKQWTI